MKTSRNSLFSLILAFTLVACLKGEVPSGSPAPDFSLPSASGETVSLSDFAGKVVVLEWLNHECPFVVRHYQSGNMQALQNRAAEDGVVWLSIISSAPGKQGHRTPEAALADHAAHQSAAAHVLIDESGEVGRLYAARTTPHMYVIDAAGSLVYQGGIDDKPRGPLEEGTVNYVTAALDALLAGEPVAVSSARPYGCSVKY